ncbi:MULTISPECIES: DEAD/DEAH box helicase [Candidatus Phytoplasma]|uniref:Type III restriction enzyme, res subunit n=2 Tax=Candidatus Phytoplasma TaxID=33926 RepID=A0ABN0J7U1_PEWBP|nr:MULTISPECIES: DEAD/DEAH box helicase [Phytoplasma]QLL37057.1 DNA repair protein RadD ['Echinacea purpurea' witches'-broom phytoplasma]WEX20602.1 MAG: DNA repair protein RadD [Candidatus Phytoplasma aurantifolia]WKV64310.1 MAG: DNA repair protein RadD [Candidatus Phytoplasma australasiaticum]EMR14526.1 type III restriction enzyme, res subunit [Peanut witches'-broom phytoplasma NTU2011]MDO8052432.1 DEAD/DEAH box helicase ['Vigna radiata' phytoplasma]
MLLNKIQKQLTDKIIKVFDNQQTTLLVAPTGSGKTIMFSFILKHFFQIKSIEKACVLVHRDELMQQNKKAFETITSNITTCYFNAKIKKWDSQVIFAMVQTLAKNLPENPNIDMLIIDEAHHSAANTYKIIIDHFLKYNPSCKILGVTATPIRGDKKKLKEIFPEITAQITIKELIKAGLLVKPEVFIRDVGIKEKIYNLYQKNQEYDLNKVAAIINTTVINSEVISYWKKYAQNRQTVIFCANIKHAYDITETFQKAGIKAQLITGHYNIEKRNIILKNFDQEKIQVIINVNVLTEGWDCQIVSCVVLLRPSSFKSTIEQMIGRGLRLVNHTKYPHITKKDCIVLDFGTSIQNNPNLFEYLSPYDSKKKKKLTQQNSNNISLNTREPKTIQFTKNIKMKKYDILKNSNFEWYDLTNKGKHYIAGFHAWAYITNYKDFYIAIGGKKEPKTAKCLFKGNEDNCFAIANDWLNLHENDKSSYKTQYWNKHHYTPKQHNYLLRLLKLRQKNQKINFSILCNQEKIKNMNKYQMSRIITFLIKYNEIKKIIFKIIKP